MVVVRPRKYGRFQIPTEASIRPSSTNLAMHWSEGQFNFEKLARTVRTAVKFLDRVIDINFYPIIPAGDSNHKWRPVGLGIMGLQDVFFALRLPFDAPKARELSKR